MSLPEPLAGLIREHRELEQLLRATRRAVSSALVKHPTPEVHLQTTERIRELIAYLHVDLPVHMEKEEEILFPAIREWAESEMQVTLTDMRHQHDEIRDEGNDLQPLLAALDVDHAELQTQTMSLAASLHGATTSLLLSHDDLRAFDRSLRIFDDLVEAHFLDEETYVFEPAARRMNSAVLATLGAQMTILGKRLGV